MTATVLCAARCSVTGESAIPQETIAQTYQRLVGRKISEADLAGITEAIRGFIVRLDII